MAVKVGFFGTLPGFPDEICTTVIHRDSDGTELESWIGGFGVELKRPVDGDRSTHWFDQLFVSEQLEEKKDAAAAALVLADTQKMTGPFPQPPGSSVHGRACTVKVADKDGNLIRIIQAQNVLVGTPIPGCRLGIPEKFFAQKIWFWTGEMDNTPEVQDAVDFAIHATKQELGQEPVTDPCADSPTPSALKSV